MATAVICEFNPFHNGHKYLLEQVKKLTNEPVMAIMSGSFTQRGEVALADKFSRAKTALQNGADLVLELPCAYAVANAQRFAQCGTFIAKSFSTVNRLAFGCESDDINLLLSAAKTAENTEVQQIINTQMKNGSYYPKAFEYAVRQVFDDKTADIITSPNNILAVEYLRGIENSQIKPLPIKRIGVDHDSTTASENIASASYIRSLLRDNQNVQNFLPYCDNEITYPEKLERIILYKLRSMTAEDFAKLPDVKEGLENRICDAIAKYNSAEEIMQYIKTKRYTHARIRRIITCALLGITEELQNMPIEYVRVLGFNSTGAELLKSCSLNVVTSVANGLKLGGNTQKLLSKDIYATDVAALAYNDVKQCKSDFTTQIIKA